MQSRHQHFKIKISVSGAAETSACGEESLIKAAELGREIGRQGAMLISGATTGIPFWAAKGIKEVGGVSVGLSPAASEEEHVDRYKLPLDYMDLIVYTGAGYSGRDILMTRSSDAVLIGCGRIGTIHEFTVAFEDNKPVGILQGPWSTDEVIQIIIEKSNRAKDNQKIVYDSNPKILVEKIIELVKKDKREYYKVYDNGDKFDVDCDGVTCKTAL